MLLNIGFTEASRRRDPDCYFFHDVDLLPENDSNIYSCPDHPRHVSAAVNTMSYELVSCSIMCALFLELSVVIAPYIILS